MTKKAALRAQLEDARTLLASASREHARGRILILYAKDGSAPLEPVLDERSNLIDVEMDVAVETVDVTTGLDSSYHKDFVSGRARTLTLRLRD